jgi:putative ABC transport system permease protein
MGSDLRQAIRSFVKHPWFTAVALITLGLGIGVNSALFSVVKAVLLEELPYGAPHQLIRVWVTNPQQGFDRDITSYPRFEDWKARSRTISSFAGFTGSRLILTGRDEPLQLRGAQVTANFFRVMGVLPQMGRDFGDGDDEAGRPRLVMLGHGFWIRAFAGDPSVIGSRLNLSGNEYTVVGIMPPSFQFPSRDVDYWVPLVLDAAARQARGSFFMDVVARLGDGVSLQQAQSEMSGIARTLETQYVDDRGLGILLSGLQADLTRPIRPALLVLSGAVVFILLICCANIAGMLSARGADREREIMIRAALGAGRRRVIRQLISETLLLFIGGGAIGIALAYLGLRMLLQIAPPELAQLQDTHLDMTMIAFTFAMSAISGLVFGLRPAFHASRANLVAALKEGGRSLAGQIESRRFRTVLTTGQIALAMVLLTGAGLLIRSSRHLGQVELGFQPSNVYVASLQLPRVRYAEPSRVSAFYDALLARVSASSGVESAAAISNVLLGTLPNSAGFSIEGRADRIITPLTIDTVTPNTFAVLKIPLIEGRLFDSRDRPDAVPVAILNATAANRYWPNGSALGKRFTFGTPRPDARWYTIVGVVADTRRAGVDKPVFTESYLPIAQNPDRAMQVLVRSSLPPASVRTAFTSALHEVDRDQPLAGFGSLQNNLDQRTASRRFVALLLTLFAGTAVCVAMVGIYGLISYLVAQRRRELGVRAALGARPQDAARLVLQHVLAMAGGGLAIGGVASWLFSRSLESLLFGVGRFDPASYGAAAAAILLTSVAAALVPARLASRVDPIIVLRGE